jgi:creatinine amidohydrolase/Fe(II)-dependent formamide hydrolase-like protein
MALWQHGITKVVMMDSHGTKLFDEEAQKIFDMFVHQTKITVEKVNPDFSWVAKTFGV